MEIEGVSLKPLLDDPTADWSHPAVTTYQRGNHSVRSKDFRYIRYQNGDEELYHLTSDPHEWYNLANQAEHRERMNQLSRWLPKVNVEDVGKK